jgi:hypothetical protein
MALSLVQVLEKPNPCQCDCHAELSVEERSAGIAALFRLDDAFRGWDYQPIYEPQAQNLYRAAQAKNDSRYRGIAMRDHACIYRRLVGFAIHELIHLFNGDVEQANYGMPFGLPYGVPVDLPDGEEARWLEPFNRGEARAWVGIAPIATSFFGIEWTLRTARDVGTYGFAGGNAIVDVPEGFRPVPHVDRIHHPQRYYALARRLEDEERGWFSDEKVSELRVRFEAAEAKGRARRKQPWPDALALAKLPPREPGRNDPCVCGSGLKWKKCCGLRDLH